MDVSEISFTPKASDDEDSVSEDDESNATNGEDEPTSSVKETHGKVDLSTYPMTIRSYNALKWICAEFLFPESVEVSTAGDSECATSSLDGAVYFYELFFKFDLHPPFLV